MEDYKKKYEDALNSIRESFHYDDLSYSGIKEKLEKAFPELKERNEDRIRKRLLGYFKDQDAQYTIRGLTNNEVITWLEKLETNPYSGVGFDYNGHHWGMCARDNGVEIIMDGEIKAFVSTENTFTNKEMNDLRTWKYIADAVLTKWLGNGQYLDNPQLEVIAKYLQERYAFKENKTNKSTNDRLERIADYLKYRGYEDDAEFIKSFIKE